MIFWLLSCFQEHKQAEPKEIQAQEQIAQEIIEKKQKMANWCDYLVADFAPHIVSDPHLDTYIDEIGQALVSKLFMNSYSYRFRILNSSEVNAYALCHGWVFVTSGMVKFVQNESEFAAVLSHEIVHNDEDHLLRQKRKIDNLPKKEDRTRDLFALLRLMHASREYEEDADEDGVKLMMQAGYDGKDYIRFLERLGTRRNQTGLRRLFASHPKIEDRIKVVRRDIRKMRILFPKPTRAQNSEQFRSFQKKIEKLRQK